MRDLYIDCETTGFSNEDRVIQLAAILAEGSNVHSMMNCYIYQDRPSNEGAFEYHQITEEMLTNLGVPVPAAIHMFLGLARCADRLIAHNMPFDKRMIRGEISSLPTSLAIDIFSFKPLFCTLSTCKKKLDLPSNKLTDVYSSLISADGYHRPHNAFNDARALMAVSLAIAQNGIELEQVQ